MTFVNLIFQFDYFQVIFSDMFQASQHGGQNTTMHLYCSDLSSIFMSSCDFSHNFLHWRYYFSRGNIANNYKIVFIYIYILNRPIHLCHLVSNSCKVIYIFCLFSPLRNAEVENEMCETVL